MKHVVITGSTRGIGLGLAEAFLTSNCSVTISGRSGENISRILADFESQYSVDQLTGQVCDVRDSLQVQALWDRAINQFKRVDIWINNAGSAGPRLPAWLVPPEKVKEIIETNLLGEIYGSMIALKGMIAQGYGAIYNMEGMGSDGRMHSGLAYYGTSNSGRHYFNKSLMKEAEDTPVIIGALRPGMVVTDLITRQYQNRPEEFERDKQIFNLLADRVETVAPWMAARILQNNKSGVSISWTSRWKIMGRFLTSPFIKRDVFKEPIGRTEQ